MTYEEFKQKILELNELHETYKKHQNNACICGYIDKITLDNVLAFLNEASVYFNVPTIYTLRYLISTYHIDLDIKSIFHTLKDDEIKFVFAEPARLYNLRVLLEAKPKAINFFFDMLLEKDPIALEEHFEFLTPENRTKYLEKHIIKTDCLNKFIMYAPNVEKIKLNPDKMYTISIYNDNINNQFFIEQTYAFLNNNKSIKKYPKIILTEKQFFEDLIARGHYALVLLAETTKEAIKYFIKNGLPTTTKHELDKKLLSAITRKFKGVLCNNNTSNG